MRVFISGATSGEATIADVADRAGVSIRTVSRVLNRSVKVNAQTRERVQAAIAALGFQPSARARGLATGRSYLLGFMHNDRNALVLDAVQRGIVAQAAGRGYELVVHPAPTGTAEALADVMRFVRRSQVDGLVILPPVWGIAGLAEALAEAGVPAVAISSVPLEGYPATLVSDERAAARDVARYLVEQGHRRIGFIAGPVEAHSAQERRAGFRSALAELGCAPATEVQGDYGFESGVAAATLLLAADSPPSAIFAANDIMAAGVLKVAAARGIAVPQGLSVVGFDGGILARMLTPALSTVERPLADMAERATACVIDLIEGIATDTALRAELTLCVHESSGRAGPEG